MKKGPTRVRYGVIAACMLMAVVLYIDRLSFSILEPYIRQDFGLTKLETGYCISAFFWFYALGQMPTGWMSDRFGPRRMLTIYIAVWSFFTWTIGFAHGLLMLMVLRGAFGLGQAGAYPTSSNVIGRWIPSSGRGSASSLIALGGRIGGAVMPLLSAALLMALVPHDKAYTLTPEMVLDHRAVMETLERPQSELTAPERYLRERLPGELFDSLTRKEVSESKTNRQEAFAQALNHLITDPSFYRADVFREMTNLGPFASDWVERIDLGETPTLGVSIQLNRFLLEGIFPVELEGVYVSSWRSVLLVYALLGVGVAGFVWLVLRDSPSEHPACNAAEQELIGVAGPETVAASGFPWREILFSRSMWASATSQFFVNVAWLFIVTWFVAFLMEEHKVSIMDRSWMLTIPMTVGFAGMLLGGKVTDWLVPRIGVRKARIFPWSGGLCFAVLAFALCPSLDDPWMITAMMAIVAFSVDFVVPSIWAFTQDVGGQYVGVVLGFGNMVGNFGAAISSPLLAYVAVTYSWDAMFYLCGGVLTISMLAALLVDASQPLVTGKQQSSVR